MNSSSSVRLAVREIAAPPPWSRVRAAIGASRGRWLLESGAGVGRWSFGGAAPRAIVRATSDADPFESLRAFVPRVRDDAHAEIPFAGGAVGYFGYELCARIERVPIRSGGEVGAPEAAWLLVDRVLAFDHASGRLFATALGSGASGREAELAAERAAERLASRIERGDVDPFEAGSRAAVAHAEPPAGAEPLAWRDAATGLELGAFFDADSYAKAVTQIRDEILAGEVYQANLTHRLAARFDGDAWRLYEVLCERSPAPFAAFLELPKITVVGASPERFLRVEPDGRVESRPIKGTRPRGATPAEDERLREALFASEKERAENAMIVDLVRNDLGRVCGPGSVTAPELFAIESYATVHQMVSTVRGRLRAGRDRIDLVRAAFPPGSMTGAPKIAAIELLAKLEPVPRGIYSGALGWLDARGAMDLSVVIRTILCRGRRAWLHAGGGIVLDSDPRAEWEETLAKLRASLDALAARQGEMQC